MEDSDGNEDYSEVVNTLMNMFGSVMSKDVIFAIVENCGGDLNLSAEAIMNINDSSSSELVHTDSTTNETIVPAVPVQLVMDSILLSGITDVNEKNINMEENDANNDRETSIPNTPLEFLKLQRITANTMPVFNEDGIKDINIISLERNDSTNATMLTYSSIPTNVINANTTHKALEANSRMSVETSAEMSDCFNLIKPLVNQIAPMETKKIPVSGAVDGLKSPESVSILNTTDITSSSKPLVGDMTTTEILIPISRTLDGLKLSERDSVSNITGVNSSILPSNETSYPSAASVFLSNSVKQLNPLNIGTEVSQNDQPIASYASMSRKTGALPKQTRKQVDKEPKINWTPQLGRIIKSHNKGHRVLILMRGLPGSGKSFLARQVIELTVGCDPINYKNHIFSTDDYFSLRGKYEFNKRYLSVAHEWNQNRVKKELEKGFSPIIVDNTSIEIWEMEPYLREGVRHGYIINIMEPKTPWAKKPSQLFRRNQHGVPLTTITRMLDNFRDNITFEYLMDFYKLSYPAFMKPPVMRNNPPFDTSQFTPQLGTHVDGIENKTDDSFVQQPQFHLQSSVVLSADIKEEKDNMLASPSLLEKQAYEGNTDAIEYITASENTVDVKNEPSTEKKYNFYTEIEKQLEEMDKVEQEWENGEEWDEDAQEKVKNICIEENIINNPKPPRNDCIDSTRGDENLMKSVNGCQDWRQISMFMPPWNDENTSSSQKIPEVTVEMISSATCMEIGDTDIHYTGNFQKVISATPRNINEYHIAPHREKIPEKRMLDKSSMTNERLITEAYRCKNEERHFIAFRKMFKSITKSALRDIFDQCCGDVNWAVEIVLDGMANNQLETVDVGEISDLEEENSDQCTCLVAYNIVPDTSSSKEEILNNISEAPTENVSQQARKIKKDIPISDVSLQLKRQIEQNFVISDDHYSDHCLKIRKMRRGELNTITNNSDEIGAIEEPQNAQALQLYTGSANDQAAPSHYTDSDNESSNTSSFDEVENIVNINIGREFVSVLDDLFGRRDMTYPENVEPKISIPVYMLNEINALWMESFMYQLDQRDKQLAIMMQQDAEFARQLAQKELELAETGKEPEVPDFKEIMDMDFAISLYQKDVAEWRNKEPNDLAAKLSRDKLYNLFPEVPQDTLSELLMAHDNNFQTTVEVLLMSTGKANILEEKNGLNKFVMQKEIERKEKILAEEQKALSEVEWPLLPVTDDVDMGVVDRYRNEADKHLVRRNANYQKAQEYIRRGMLQVASYYSDIATFHKQRFDHANSLAAASLIQVHAANNPDNATIDLHYLRVGEAKESLDLFLDMHINKLKESQAANRGPREHTLFFITGRGLHSSRGPKVKPAVKKRLRERGLIFSERNPGLLSAKVTADDKLSYQVQVP